MSASHETPAAAPPLLRPRHGHAKVTNEELFFDLIYAFAVTQLSHRLLEHLDPLTALQTLVLWFAVWLGWQYTSWITNWFNPEHRSVRTMLFVLMLLGLAMAAAIPDAYGERGLAFAACYVALQVGRSAFALAAVSRSASSAEQRALRDNFGRILGWVCISGVLWACGAFAQGPARLAWWAAAVLCEYVSPMLGFRLPGLGRSDPARDWTIDGGHLAERCQLFVIVALGESILATGAGFAASPHWDGATLAALASAFAGSVAMWWVYFDTGSRDGTAAIEHADEPGRIGAYFHYIHVTLIAGVIVSAVADELVLHHPHERVDAAAAAVLIGGPLIYLLGNAAYKRVVYGALPLSHLAGIGLLAALAPLGWAADRLTMGALTSAVLIVVAAWQSRHPRALPARAGRGASH